MLTVKKLADLLGLSPEVIRHYTHMGILKPVVNSGNNYKYYDEQDLLYLANIRVNRSLGLSLPQAQDFQSGSVKEQRHLLTERSRPGRTHQKLSNEPRYRSPFIGDLTRGTF